MCQILLLWQLPPTFVYSQKDVTLIKKFSREISDQSNRIYPNAIYIIKELINYIKENIVSICSNLEKLREIIKTRIK